MIKEEKALDEEYIDVLKDTEKENEKTLLDKEY